jgi:hypothetical protein
MCGISTQAWFVDVQCGCVVTCLAIYPSAMFSMFYIEARNYFIVTFNTVANPVFTVAVVLTPAKPGADTVTV